MTQSTNATPDRRRFLTALASLPLAGVLADSGLAAEIAAGLDTVTLTTPAGRTVSAALAVPERVPAPAVILFHEWWGLTDQIKSVAAVLAREGYLALAADLYHGRTASTPAEARALMGAVKTEEANDTAAAWIDWLKHEPRSTGKVATLGWCFGGGWSLNASLLTPVDATIIYYGRVDKTPEQLAALHGEVLGHFGTKDGFINQNMVSGFEAAMKAAGKTFTTYWYEADHAFANPSGANYDQPDADLAWSRTLAFLKDKLH